MLVFNLKLFFFDDRKVAEDTVADDVDFGVADNAVVYNDSAFRNDIIALNGRVDLHPLFKDGGSFRRRGDGNYRFVYRAKIKICARIVGEIAAYLERAGDEDYIAGIQKERARNYVAFEVLADIQNAGLDVGVSYVVLPGDLNAAVIGYRAFVGVGGNDNVVISADVGERTCDIQRAF